MSLLEFGSERIGLERLATEAAKVADAAAERVMAEYRKKFDAGEREEEPAITGRLAQAIGDAFSYKNIEGVELNSTIVKSSKSAKLNEDKVGADILLHVKIETPMTTVSKGVLIQAKRKEQTELLNKQEAARLKKQCKDMLSITKEAYVFDYDTKGIRTGAARSWLTTEPRALRDVCKEGIFDFFNDFFKCDKGDRKITSFRVNQLVVPYKVKITAKGNIGGVT